MREHIKNYDNINIEPKEPGRKNHHSHKHSGGLSKLGHKTLLVDTDPQANATIGLLGEIPKQHIAEVFTGDLTAKKVMIERSKNLYVLPSSIELAKTTQQIANMIAREYVLKKALQEIKNLDYIIIDTPRPIIIKPKRMDYKRQGNNTRPNRILCTSWTRPAYKYYL